MNGTKRAIAVVALFAIMLLGCSAVSAAEQVTVLLATGGFSRAAIAAAEAFQADTGIQVRILNYAYPDAREQQILDLASGRGGIDVVAIDDVTWLAELYPFLEPLDNRIEADEVNVDRFVPSMLDLFRHGGHTYGFPFRIGGWIVIYRQDLFDQAGIDPHDIVTWNDFLHAAQALTTGDVYGFAPAFQQGNFLVNQWLPILFSFGGELLTEDNKAVAFNTDEGRAATQYMVDLMRKHGVVSPAAVTYEHEGVITALQRGTAAMALTYSPYYMEVADPAKSRFASEFAVLDRIPCQEGMDGGHSIITGWGFGISRASRNKDAAWEFIKYVTSEEMQLELAVSYANSPTIESVFSNPTYVEKWPYAANIATALSTAFKRPMTPAWGVLEDILASELSTALHGTKTVEEALNDAAEAIQAEL